LINAQSDITVVTDGTRVQLEGEVLDDNLFDGTFRCELGQAIEVDFVRNHSLVEAARIHHTEGDLFTGEIVVEEGTVDFDAIPELWLEGAMMQNGSPLTAWAFQRGLSPFGNWGHLIVTFGVFLFGLSTAISWSYYGDRSIVYLFGRKYILYYKLIFVLMHFLGAIVSLEIVWYFGDSALGLMALPNLIALVALLGATRLMTKEYFSKKHVPLR